MNPLRMKLSYLFPLSFAFILLSCSSPSVPGSFAESNELPTIYPDYTEVTVPINIAPLTFEWDGPCQDMVARFSCGSTEVVCGGDGKAQPSMSDWRQLAEAACGGSITVDVYKQDNDQWTHFKPFNIYVSPDSITPWLSYRLISPSYVAYEELTLNQRCLENYDERVMVDNMLCGLEATGQCVNCHNYQQYNPGRMQFHARQFHGGTVIVYDGKMKKVNMKNDSIISAGVYPAWHPWLPLIVYSTNHTSQSFHTRNLNKIEVFDSASDLIVYNVETDEVSNIENEPDEFEVFPAWAPDGRALYFCSAHFVHNDSLSAETDVISRATELKYSLYKKSFDPDTRRFGPRELVYQPQALPSGDEGDTLASASATLPRVSPDGRFLLFTQGHYGVFHIWHHEADLYLLDLQAPVDSLNPRPFEELNSPDTESYHSWSSNGRWVVFSSRRDDGGYTRPFIGHVDANGRGSKPFELPQADPDYHRQFMKSYNIPEFMNGPVEHSPQEFADVLKRDNGVPVKYVSQ